MQHWSVCLSVCLTVYLSVCLPVSLSVSHFLCLFTHFSIFLFVCRLFFSLSTCSQVYVPLYVYKDISVWTSTHFQSLHDRNSSIYLNNILADLPSASVSILHWSLTLSTHPSIHRSASHNSAISVGGDRSLQDQFKITRRFIFSILLRFTLKLLIYYNDFINYYHWVADCDYCWTHGILLKVLQRNKTHGQTPSWNLELILYEH